VLTVESLAAAPDARGCARRVVFNASDAATGESAPSSLCVADVAQADAAPEGAWFWLETVLDVELPDGKAVFAVRIRASDVDPDKRGRAMRVAYWNGRLDGASSTGVFRGRSGRLDGGGELFFDAPKGARAEIILAFEVDGAPAPGIVQTTGITFRDGRAPCLLELDLALRGGGSASFCRRAVEGSAEGADWFVVRGDLRLALPGGVIDVLSWEQRDPEDPGLYRLVWRGVREGGGTLFGIGTFRLRSDETAELDLRFLVR
jgi:hypothetical protein